MSIKEKNNIKLMIVFLMIAILLMALIVSQDEHHIDNCSDDNCAYCTIINIARNIMILSISFVIAIITGVLIYFFLSRLNKEINIIIKKSLVFQKVQLNE